MTFHAVFCLIDVDQDENISSLVSQSFELENFRIERAFPKGGWIGDHYAVGELAGSCVKPDGTPRHVAVRLQIVSYGDVKYEIQKLIPCNGGNPRNEYLNRAFVGKSYFPLAVYARRTSFYGRPSRIDLTRITPAIDENRIKEITQSLI